MNVTHEMTLAAFFIAGLASSVHCLAMCGGVAGSLNVRSHRAPVQGLFFNLAFNGGRIASYALAGLLVGSLGLGLASLLDLRAWSGVLRIVTGVLMIAVGLQLAINWRGLARLESKGMLLWRHIAPLTRRLLPVENVAAAGALGALWGWLPCGMVYSMLLMAATVGDPVTSSLSMASFGLGTMPAMIGVGAVAGAFSSAAARPRMRMAAGALVAGFGVWTIAAVVLMPLLAHAHQG